LFLDVVIMRRAEGFLLILSKISGTRLFVRD